MTYGLDTSVVVRLLMCEPPELAVKARDFVEAALDVGGSHDYFRVHFQGVCDRFL